MQNWMENDREVLARTLMAEAGNQGPLGMLAAGSVIMNRARTPGYGDGVRGVILKPGQFSPWNSVTGYAGGEQGQNMAAIRPTSEAYDIADRLLSGQYEDPTGGATHFYNPDISSPSWGQAAGGKWTRIGSHIFGQAGAGRSSTGDTDMVRGGAGQTSMMGQSGADFLASEQERPRGLLGGFFGPEGRDRRARLAIALEGMTLNPNQALIGGLQEEVTERREERKAAAQRNLTAAWLESQGLTQLAQGVTTGAIPATTALTIYQAQAKAAKDPNVQSSAMLPDQSGTVLTMRDGGIQVVTVGGETLSGQDAIDFVKKAQEKNVEYQQSIYRARRLGTGLGETAAADISAAPATISTADTTLAYIDALRNHPGIEMGTGFSSTFNAIPGTPGYDFQNRVKQISSGAFMTAIQDLRGMGALSNAEGDTATKAVARMDTATSKEEFLAALADYERIVQAGKARAQKIIETQGGQAPAAGAPSGGGTTRLRYNATTGQMEPVND